MSSSPRPDVVMLVHTDVRSDGRVRKEAATLAAQGRRVVVVGMSLAGPLPPPVEQMDGFTVVRVAPRLLRRALPGKTGRRLRLLASLVLVPVQLRRLKGRVYHAHDFLELLLVNLAGIRRPVVYDSHELYFDQKIGSRFALNDLMQLLRPLEKPLARRAAAVITVSEPIADRLAQTLGIPRPIVLQNAVDLRYAGPPVVFSAGGRKIVAHTGALSLGRHLPELVESLAHLPDEIALVLIGGGPLKAALLEQAARLGVGDRLIIVPPVPVNSVSPTLAQADCAALLFAPDSPNYQLALPNKFFEAVAAGVPLVYGTTQEVGRLAREYDLGVSCNPTDPRSIAEAIQTILQPENLARYRENAVKAREILNWEQEEKKLVALYRRILGDE